MCSCAGSTCQTRTSLHVRSESDDNMAGVPGGGVRPRPAPSAGRRLTTSAARGGWPAGTALTPAQGIGTRRTGGVRARGIVSSLSATARAAVRRVELTAAPPLWAGRPPAAPAPESTRAQRSVWRAIGRPIGAPLPVDAFALMSPACSRRARALLISSSSPHGRARSMVWIWTWVDRAELFLALFRARRMNKEIN